MADGNYDTRNLNGQFKEIRLEDGSCFQIPIHGVNKDHHLLISKDFIFDLDSRFTVNGVVGCLTTTNNSKLHLIVDEARLNDSIPLIEVYDEEEKVFYDIRSLAELVALILEKNLKMEKGEPNLKH